MSIRHAGWMLLVSACVLATPAQAHLVQTGFGDFYDGLAHVALTPAELLIVIAMALLAGQRGPLAARWTLFVLPIAWLAGGLIGARMPDEITLPVLTTLSFALAGIFVVLDARVPAAMVAGFGLAVGLVHGAVNGANLAPTGASLLGLAGAVSAVFCLFAMLSAQMTTLRAGWTRIAVRAVGSWIAAAGLLMLGWLARPLVAS